MSPAPGALRDRLGELVRRRRAGVVPAPTAVAPERASTAKPATSRTRAPRASRASVAPEAIPRRTPPRPSRRTSRTRAGGGLESFLPGGEWSHPTHGAVYVHERLRGDIERPHEDWGRLPEPPTGETELAAVRERGLARVMFLDLETCGLSSCPVFLAGTMIWNGEDFVVRQYFARHYGEEAALLAAVAEQARGYETLITFNGKSYDAPFLRARAITHGVPLELPRNHLDLVHHARRRWRTGLPDCRLTTLERRVCGRLRTGDVPGSEIPGLYHAFVKDSDPWPLVPVFHHNLLDVLTMADLLHALCRPGRPARLAWAEGDALGSRSASRR